MISRPLLPLAALLAALWAAETTAQEPASLKDDAIYQAALRAMTDELPDLAVQRLNEVLSSLKPDDPNRPTVLLRLGEALVRSGESEEALKKLADPSLAKNDEARFWSARAEIAAGRLMDAADLLGELAATPDPDLRRLATMGRARLLASLGNTAEASALFELLEADSPGPVAQEAAILRASLLLEEAKTAEASELLKSLDPESPVLRKRKLYLEARLALAGGDPGKAHQIFQELIADPVGLSRALYRSAVLGDADTLHGLERTPEAFDLLLTYIDSRPTSNFLESFFARLTSWSAGQEPLRTLLQTRLATWSKGASPAEQGLLRSLNDPTAVALANYTSVEHNNLSALALYHRALLLAERNNSEAVAEARSLLARLRLEYPTHPLAVQSLLETGRLFLAEKKTEHALATLAVLSSVAGSPALRSSAAELAGRVEFAQGDFAEAAGAFARARANLQTDDRHVTAINHGLSLLEADDPKGFEDLLASVDDELATQTLLLEQALRFAAKHSPEASPMLDSFLRHHPASPRIAEARLAMAEVSVQVEPYDPSMALAQLDSIDTSRLSAPFALRHLLARLRHAELTGQWDTAIAEANAYLRTRESPAATGLLLKLGEAYYRNGDYNQAHIQFLQAANRESAPAQQEVARFYAAKAAMRVGTDAARSDAIKLLAQVVDSGSLLATDARLQLAAAFLEAANPKEALETLAPLIDDPEGGSAHVDAFLLSAQSYRALGTTADLEKCLAVYDRLLERKDLEYPLNNRIHFLKGLTLEQLQQSARALEPYFQVINGENLPEGAAISEWKWYYDCGFSALRLLEADKRWRSAFAVAKKLSETGGPRAEEAAKRAQAIQLDHMIWSDQ